MFVWGGGGIFAFGYLFVRCEHDDLSVICRKVIRVDTETSVDLCAMPDKITKSQIFTLFLSHVPFLVLNSSVFVHW